MRRQILLFVAIAIAAGLAGIYFGHRQTSPAAPQEAALERLFEQEWPDSSGSLHSLSQWKGKTLLVNFWATWCAPCVEEMPELSALQAEAGPHNIQVVGIGIDSAENIAAFAKKLAITYPLYVGGIASTDLTRQLGNQVGGLPFTVLINADGTMEKSYLGRLKMEEVRKDLSLPRSPGTQ